MNDWIFILLPIAAVVHIIEEYLFPGGFTEAFRKLLPRASHLFTVKFHILVNVIFILMCFIAALIGQANLILSLSVFGLIFTNAVLHIRGAIIQKGYYPGVISGIFIYIPIAIYAYSIFINSKQLSWIQAIISFLLGALYMGVLMIIVLTQQRSKSDNAYVRKE
jgi:hypothetical protein